MNWVLLGLLAAACLILVILLLRERRRVGGLRREFSRLSSSIAAFLAEPKKAAYSLREDDAAHLQNSIAALESAYLQAKSLLAGERRRNYQFIADVSHQLKTPLAGLKLYVELSGGENADRELLLIERMEKLIWQLLRMEKLRAGAYEFSYESIDLKRLVDEIWQELSGLYPEHRLTVSGEASLRADPIWLKEALHNIVKNSCEQPAGRGPIAVRLEQTDSTVHIEIEDASGGVKSLDTRQLFERFNALTPEDSKRNTGLGLAITKTIIERHHGSISAKNTALGLKMTIDLPIIDGYRSY